MGGRIWIPNLLKNEELITKSFDDHKLQLIASIIEKNLWHLLGN